MFELYVEKNGEIIPLNASASTRAELVDLLGGTKCEVKGSVFSVNEVKARYIESTFKKYLTYYFILSISFFISISIAEHGLTGITYKDFFTYLSYVLLISFSFTVISVKLDNTKATNKVRKFNDSYAKH